MNGSDHLYVNYWDGTQWRWADQGGVLGGFQGSLKVLHTPSAITYLEGSKQLIYVFVVGDDGAGGNVHLHVNYWDGAHWRWADQGTPPGTVLKQIPSAITYAEGGKERIYVFAGGADHNLHVNYWNGQWQWGNQGHPAIVNPSIDLNGKGTITYSEGGKQRIYIFVPIGKRLYLNYWDGAQWHWTDQGQPFPQADNISLTTLDSAITYKIGTTQYIEDFIIGTDQKLYRHYWDGAGWHWVSLGSPPQTAVNRMIGAIHYYDSVAKEERKYIFVTGYQQLTDPHLYVCYWNNNAWHWADQGKPATLGSNNALTGEGSVITFAENKPAGKQLISVFATATNGHLYLNYGDGAHWQWADQGTP